MLTRAQRLRRRLQGIRYAVRQYRRADPHWPVAARLTRESWRRRFAKVYHGNTCKWARLTQDREHTQLALLALLTPSTARNRRRWKRKAFLWHRLNKLCLTGRMPRGLNPLFWPLYRIASRNPDNVTRLQVAWAIGREFDLPGDDLWAQIFYRSPFRKL